MAAPVGEDGLPAAAARWGRDERNVLAKGRRWPTTRVFQAGDMIDFLYFDDAGVLRDYVFVSA